MPSVTVYHVEISRNEQGARRIKVFGIAAAANGEMIRARDVGLKTIEWFLAVSRNPNINIAGIISNPGSFDNYVTIYGSDVSGTAPVAAGSTEFDFLAIGF